MMKNRSNNLVMENINRVRLQPICILHRRPFSNTSLIIDVFSRDYGRLSLLARSARGLQSRYRGKLDAFFPMLADWAGSSELKTLGAVEFSEPPIILEGAGLLSGLYVNEIVMRLIPPYDACPAIWEAYCHTLHHLTCADRIQPTLRYFEKKLLQAVGYGLSLTQELHSGAPIDPDVYYEYIPDRGFFRSEVSSGLSAETFRGSSLWALHHEQLNDTAVLADAKRLMRFVLGYHLGYQSLKSRDLLK